MGINYAEGWQKKKVSEAIRERGQQEIKKDSRQAAQTLERLEAARTAAVKTEGAAKAAQAKAPPAKPAAPRGETAVRHDAPKDGQEKARRHGDEAASNFIQAQDRSRSLSQLLSKTQAVKPQGHAATHDAVAQKTNVPNAQPGRPLQPQNPAVRTPTAAATGRAATEFATQKTRDPSTTLRASEERRTRDEGLKTKDEGRGTRDEKKQVDQTRAAEPIAKQPDNVKTPAVAIAGEPAVPSPESRIPGPESRIPNPEKRADSRKKSGQTARTGGVYGERSGAGRELDALLDGFGGSDLAGGGGGNETTAAAAGVAAPELPERDPEFHVYNGDRSNPVDDVKSKAQVFVKHVEKRLQKAAKLDEEVDGMIRNLFETQGLSGRIVGEIDDEIREELNAARFLYGTVYGGLIG